MSWFSDKAKSPVKRPDASNRTPSDRAARGADSKPRRPAKADGARRPAHVKAATGAGLAAPVPPAVAASDSEFAATEQLVLVIDTYADVPPYQRLLTAGDDPVYRLPVDLQAVLVATDVGGKRAQILCAADGPVRSPHYQWQLRALKCDLRAKGFQLGQELLATAEVLRTVLRNAGRHTHSQGRGEPLRLFNLWIELAAAAGATDVHIEVQGNVAQVRVRIDGRLEALADGQGGRYPRAEAIDALAAGYNNTRQGNNVSQYTEDKFVSCMIALNLPGLTGQMRYQNLKGRAGPKAVVRILRSGGDNHITFEQAGYAPSHLRLLRDAARAGKGIVLFAGVTSSGKSTSLKCLIESLPGLESKAIYTVEDPIEYEIRGAHQIEVLRDLADDELTTARYADTMRALLRGDPDGVMLGEIRDRLTAGFALQVAETGHLAVGTVHAHLLSNIVPRLTNEQIGLSRRSLTGPHILNLLVYQALVPVLCPRCADRTAAACERDAHAREVVEVLTRRWGLPAEGLRWLRPGGCSSCAGRGTRGKTLVAEVLRPDRQWSRLVRDHDDDAAVMHYRSRSDGDALSPDMTGKTVFEHALWKSLQGQIDIRECEEFDSFQRFDFLPPRGGRP